MHGAIALVEGRRDANKNGRLDSPTDSSSGFDTSGSSRWTLVMPKNFLGCWRIHHCTNLLKMDLMTFYTCMAAVAAGASAIMAWTARSDSLKAQSAASDAQERATQIAEKSVQALDRANQLAEDQFQERVSLERRIARARWASLLRGWMMSKSLRSTLPSGQSLPSTIRRVTFAEVNDERIALDEKTADRLQGAIAAAINKMIDELNGLPQAERLAASSNMPVRLAVAEQLIEAWIAEPESISDALKTFDSANAAP